MGLLFNFRRNWSPFPGPFEVHPSPRGCAGTTWLFVHKEVPGKVYGSNQQLLQDPQQRNINKH